MWLPVLHWCFGSFDDTKQRIPATDIRVPLVIPRIHNPGKRQVNNPLQDNRANPKQGVSRPITIWVKP